MSNGANMILGELRKNLAASNPMANLLAGAQGATGLNKSLLQNQALQQALEQQAQQAPLQNQLLQQRADAGELDMQASQSQQNMLEDQATRENIYKASKAIKPFIEKGDVQGALASLDQLEQFGMPEESTRALEQLLSAGDIEKVRDGISTLELYNQADSVGAKIMGLSRVLKKEGNKTFEEYITDRVQADGTPFVVRREITGDIAKKTTGLTAVEEADLKVDTAGKTQRAKLMADLDLKPSVQAAVEESVLGVRAEADKKKEEKGAERAFAVYDSAMNNLFNSLGETTTGPIIGWLPAFTANQQTADGAVAAMAPVLKDIFKVAGEGTFTNADQELLLKMLPDRQTHPEARARQAATVDAIVRAKMGQSVTMPSTVLGEDVSMAEVFDEAVKNKMTVEQVMSELGIE